MRMQEMCKQAVNLFMCMLVVASLFNGIRAYACDSGTTPKGVPYLGSPVSGYQDITGCHPTLCSGTCYVSTAIPLDYCGAKQYGDSGGCEQFTQWANTKQGECGAKYQTDNRECGCRNLSPNTTMRQVNSAISC